MVRRHLYNLNLGRPRPAPAPVPPVAPPRGTSTLSRSEAVVSSSPTPSARSGSSHRSVTGTASTSASASGSTTAAASSSPSRPVQSPPSPPHQILGRIHCFGDQPLEITDSLKGYRRHHQGLPDPVFHPAGAPASLSLPRPLVTPLGPLGLGRWWPLCRWLLLAALVAVALALVIFFLARTGSNIADTPQYPASDDHVNLKEPPTGDWSAADEVPFPLDQEPHLPEDPGPPEITGATESISVVYPTSSLSTSTSTSSAPSSTTTPPSSSSSSSTTTSSSSSSSSTERAGQAISHAANQTRAVTTGAKTDKDEDEILYDSDELVIDGDDGDAEYEGDTDQTLPEFLESILSLWSSPAPPKVLNGHRYGDTQAGDQWPVASSSSPAPPSPSTRPPGALVSPTLPPRLSLVHRVTPAPTPDALTDGDCESPRLPLCRGLLPYDLTLGRPAVPQVPALRTAADLAAALPYFELVAQSGCSPRARAFLCPLLEPECVPRATQPRKPCRRLCRAVAEACHDFILNNLDLSRVFDCSNYPDSSHGDECLDLSVGGTCLPREFSCGDGSCIPQRWLCDGRADCAFGADERNCTTVCPDDHFRCAPSQSSPSPGAVSCVRASQRCDGRADCADGSDELGCAANTGAAALGPVSPCPAGELRCLDGRCIGLEKLCDGIVDCMDEADEANCPAITATARRVRAAAGDNVTIDTL